MRPAVFRRCVLRCAAFNLCAILLGAIMVCVPASLRAQSASSAGDADQVKAHVKEILNQPEFQPESPDSPMAQLGRSFRENWEKTSRWVQARWKAFQKWLEHLFSGFGGGAAAGVASVFSNAFALLFIGFGGWLIAWLIRSLWIGRRTRLARTRTAYTEAEEDEGVLPEPGAWIQQAGVYAGAEDYRRAFRAVFVAILLLLDEGGLIEFDRARTNGDYVRLLSRKNVRRLYEILDPLVLEFDHRWYGRAETGYEDFIRIQQTFERVRTLMAAEAAPASMAGAAS